MPPPAGDKLLQALNNSYKANVRERASQRERDRERGGERGRELVSYLIVVFSLVKLQRTTSGLKREREGECVGVCVCGKWVTTATKKRIKNRLEYTHLLTAILFFFFFICFALKGYTKTTPLNTLK